MVLDKTTKTALAVASLVLGLAILLVVSRVRTHEAPETLFVDVVSDVPEETWMMVDLKGAVRMPGVYRVAQGTRLFEVIERAGGLRNDACVEALNLAQVLVDQRMIRVPYVGEDITDNGKTSLSTATLEALVSLPSIGPATAERIIEYRTEHGPFQSVDEVVNVNGIGESTLETIRPYVVP